MADETPVPRKAQQTPMEVAQKVLLDNGYKFDSAVTNVTPIVRIYALPSGERVGLQPGADSVVLLNDKDIERMQGHNISPNLGKTPQGKTLDFRDIFVKFAQQYNVLLPNEQQKKMQPLAQADQPLRR